MMTNYIIILILQINKINYDLNSKISFKVMMSIEELFYCKKIGVPLIQVIQVNLK